MSRLYRYVGPPELAERSGEATTGLTVTGPEGLERWVLEQSEWDADRLTVTFVVLPGGVVRVAPRRSEHVDCARGAAVVAAGELVLGRPPHLAVIGASNQSTGYCPEPECWASALEALRGLGIPAPAELQQAYTFRMCPKCQERNLVKDGWFVCALCGAVLPEAWNFA